MGSACSTTSVRSPGSETLRHLVIDGSLDGPGYGRQVVSWYAEALERLDGPDGEPHVVEVRRLAELQLEPVLLRAEYAASVRGEYPRQILEEQAAVRAADTLTLVFPLWWVGFPAQLKGWVDRVLGYGFAYALEGESPIPGLMGRRAATVATMGNTVEDYRRDGTIDAMERIWDAHIFRFCGLEPAGHVWLGNAALANDGERDQHRQALRELARKVGGAVDPADP